MGNNKDNQQNDVLELLVNREAITQENLEKAREESARLGLSVMACLENMQIISYEDVAKVRADALGIPYMELTLEKIDKDVVALIPQETLVKYKTMPLFKDDQVFTIGMVNPENIEALDHIQRIRATETIDVVLVSEKAFLKVLNECFEVSSNLVGDILNGIDIKNVAEVSEEKNLIELSEEAPIVKLVNVIIAQAAKERASDVHIEPESDSLRVRYRVDGVMREALLLPMELKNALTSRVKILSSLDISEVRKPQDGRIKFKVEDKIIDLRVSTFPTIYGENVVIRLLDKMACVFQLSDLGFLKRDMEAFDRLIYSPNGIILVTGPTGSGKTSTLYSVLFTINSINKTIVTIEDPVEYELPLIRQTQVNPVVGVTFANGLRNILRQDPDVIMVGEIRDEETANTAIQAALTGHLVLSTLHTNDAVSSISRLINMNVKPFLISSSVIGVVAQRLVRRNCEHCKEVYTPRPEILKEFGVTEPTKFFQGRGCEKCKGTGFWGRLAIFEIFIINDEIRRMIDVKSSDQDIKDKAIQLGMVTLRENGLIKALEGLTTLENILHVTGYGNC